MLSQPGLTWVTYPMPWLTDREPCVVQDLRHRGIDGADNAGWRKGNRYLTIQILRQGALNETRPKAPPAGSHHERPSGLPPAQVEPRRRNSVLQLPRHFNGTSLVGQGAVLHGVGCQLVQGHGQ